MADAPKTNPKQTQTNPIKANLRNDQNEHNLSINKELWKYTALRTKAKQTQFKPKRTQFPGPLWTKSSEGGSLEN